MSRGANDPKSLLRKDIRSMLAGLDPRTLERDSGAIRDLVLGEPRLTGAAAGSGVVMLFAPLPGRPGEVDLLELVALLRGRGIRVAFPATDWQSRTMQAWEVTDASSDLVRVAPRAQDADTARDARRQAGAGASGGIELLEPRQGCARVGVQDLRAVLVPGLAFDRTGGRLGRGAGFYDRFLAGLPASVLVCGVGLSSQIVARVPLDAHDVPMHAIITETSIFSVPERRPD